MRPGFGVERSESAEDPLNPLIDDVFERRLRIRTQVQLWWERKWNTPARGNPLWEDVPFTEHLRSLFEHAVAEGTKPAVVDGKLYLEESVEDGVMAIEGKDGIQKLVSEKEYEASLNAPTGDEWFDEMTREIESGEDDFQNPFGER